jgi:uncharacterized Zn-finger protein
MSEETVKCPYCKYVYRTDVEKTSEDGRIDMVRKFGEEIAPQPVANYRVDLTCPNCGEEFKWPQR